MKAWLLRWLGVSALWVEHEQLRKQVAEMKSQHEADIAQLIHELNAVRNNVTVSQPPQPTTRVFRNFREFRDAVEGAPARILIERKTP